MVAKSEAATPAKPEKKSLSQKGRSGGVNAENGFLAEVPRQATPAQLAAMLGVLEHMIRVPIGRPFAHPVKADDAPGYADVIARPMDLGSIAKGLTSGGYTSIGAHPLQQSIAVLVHGTGGKLPIIYFVGLVVFKKATGCLQPTSGCLANNKKDIQLAWLSSVLPVAHQLLSVLEFASGRRLGAALKSHILLKSANVHKRTPCTGDTCVKHVTRKWRCKARQAVQKRWRMMLHLFGPTAAHTMPKIHRL